MFDMNPAVIQQPVPVAYSPRAIETTSLPKSSLPNAVKEVAKVELPQQQAAKDDGKGVRGELVDVLA